MTTDSKKPVLAIESAIRGGALALFIDGSEVDARSGDTDVSRAEDLLANISEMLASHGLVLSDLGSIAISVGPGSFTGIRIGMATVLGLRRASAVECRGISVLAAIASASGHTVRPTAAIIPVGRNEIAWQIFHGRGEEKVITPEVGDIDTVLDMLAHNHDIRPVFHRYLTDTFGARIRSVTGEILPGNICTNPASAIGNLSINSPSAHLPLEPFYLQNPRHKGLGVG